MSAIFQAIAKDSKTGNTIKAQVFIGGKDHGWTSGKKDDYLIIEKSTSMKYNWYMKYNGEKISSGSSKGGEIIGFK